MIQRSPEYMTDGMPPPEMLRSVLKEHMHNRMRLQELADAYGGNSAIVRRSRAPGLPNNRIAHPFARYIVAVSTGYLVGNPVTYSCAEDSEALAAITDVFRRGSIASVDAENARNAAIYGRGVEYVHVDADGMPHATALSPMDAFLVYENSYDMRPLFGVYMIPKTKADGSQDGFRIWVMTEVAVMEYHAADLNGGAFSMVESIPHFFGGVPLVEYWNDESERGDFEWVMPLIDAYDAIQSDRVNDKEQFVDALLVLTGCVMEIDERGREPWRQLREDKALCLPDNQAKAEYLARQMSEADVEVLRAALAEDIHKLSMVPDLSDKNFAANASGVAMRYKLWGLEQLVNVKQRWFIEGLRNRLQLYANFMELRGFKALDVSDVKIEMARAMPANLLEQAQIANMAESAGAASIEQRVRILHDGQEWTENDIQKEVARIRVESVEPDPLAQFGNVIPGNTEEQLIEQDEV